MSGEAYDDFDSEVQQAARGIARGWKNRLEGVTAERDLLRQALVKWKRETDDHDWRGANDRLAELVPADEWNLP